MVVSPRPLARSHWPRRATFRDVAKLRAGRLFVTWSFAADRHGGRKKKNFSFLHADRSRDDPAKPAKPDMAILFLYDMAAE